MLAAILEDRLSRERTNADFTPYRQQAHMGGEDSSCVCKTGSSGFRWLCLARSALALVVTVLAAVVLVNGLRLVLQPGTTIELNIAQSDVFVQRYEYNSTTAYYSFRFYLEANNPSKAVFISYRNMAVKLYDMSPPMNGLLLAEFALDPPSLSLPQMEEQEYLVHSLLYHANVPTKQAEEKLNVVTTVAGGVVEGAIMVLSGELSVANYIQPGIATSRVMFACEQVKVKSSAQLTQPSSENFKAYCLKA